MATACESGSAGSSIHSAPGEGSGMHAWRGPSRDQDGDILQGVLREGRRTKADMDRRTRSGGSKAPWREWRYVGADIKPYYGRPAASRESSGVMDLWYAFE